MKKYLIISTFLFFLLTGCQPSLNIQPRLGAYSISTFYADQSSDRMPVADTFPHEKIIHPLKRDRAVLERGKNRYEIYCMVCHGAVGDGDGIVTHRGFSHPPSYHIEYLRKVNDAHFYDVITNGKGLMTRLGDRILPNDRWAIIAYIRHLQETNQ